LKPIGVLLVFTVLAGCGTAGSHSGTAPPGGDSGTHDAFAPEAGKSANEAGTSDGYAEAAGGDAGAATEDAPPEQPAPLWNPPFPLGSPGWRSSSVPYCTKNEGIFQAYDVWADFRGVFALIAADCNGLASVACGREGTNLQFNDGTGWRTVYRSAAKDRLNLTGFDGGPVVLSNGSCSVQEIDIADGGATCLAIFASYAGTVFVVDSNDAYAWSGQKIEHFDGAQWTPFAQVQSNIVALWADSHIAVGVGAGQAIYFKADGSTSFAAMPNVPAGDYGSVWAFSASDIWAGNTAGQLVHYDGSQWTTIPTGSMDTTGQGIAELWGASGTLYFITPTEFGRYTGSSAQLLLTHTPGARISIDGMWGTSPTDVFLAVTDSQYRGYACEGAFLVYFDGSQFHEF
jgi:hypothetical protein